MLYRDVKCKDHGSQHGYMAIQIRRRIAHSDTVSDKDKCLTNHTHLDSEKQLD